jgi:hypothetical protein
MAPRDIRSGLGEAIPWRFAQSSSFVGVSAAKLRGGTALHFGHDRYTRRGHDYIRHRKDG